MVLVPSLEKWILKKGAAKILLFGILAKIFMSSSITKANELPFTIQLFAYLFVTDFTPDALPESVYSGLGTRKRVHWLQ